MSENLAAWHRPHLGKVQTQVMAPAGDLLLDLSPHGGREATKSKEVPPDLSPASKKANGLYMVISDWFQVFDKDQNGWIDKEEFNVRLIVIWWMCRSLPNGSPTSMPRLPLGQMASFKCMTWQIH